MASLFEEGDLPGAGALDGRRPPEAGDVPAGGVSPGPAPEPPLVVDREVVSPAPRTPKVVKPAWEPREVKENRVLSGEPPAPPALSVGNKAIADYKLKNPTMHSPEIAEKFGIAAATAQQVLNKPQVKLYMSAHLNKAGATLEKAAKVIAEAHDATTKTYISFEGEIRDEREDPDHPTRIKAAKVSMEAHGALDDKGIIINQYSHLSDEQLAEIRAGRARPDDFIEGQAA